MIGVKHLVACTGSSQKKYVTDKVVLALSSSAVDVPFEKLENGDVVIVTCLSPHKMSVFNGNQNYVKTPVKGIVCSETEDVKIVTFDGEQVLLPKYGCYSIGKLPDELLPNMYESELILESKFEPEPEPEPEPDSSLVAMRKSKSARDGRLAGFNQFFSREDCLKESVCNVHKKAHECVQLFLNSTDSVDESCIYSGIEHRVSELLRDYLQNDCVCFTYEFRYKPLFNHLKQLFKNMPNLHVFKPGKEVSLYHVFEQHVSFDSFMNNLVEANKYGLVDLYNRIKGSVNDIKIDDLSVDNVKNIVKDLLFLHLPVCTYSHKYQGDRDDLYTQFMTLFEQCFSSSFLETDDVSLVGVFKEYVSPNLFKSLVFRSKSSYAIANMSVYHDVAEKLDQWGERFCRKDSMYVVDGLNLLRTLPPNFILDYQVLNSLRKLLKLVNFSNLVSFYPPTDVSSYSERFLWSQLLTPSEKELICKIIYHYTGNSIYRQVTKVGYAVSGNGSMEELVRKLLDDCFCVKSQFFDVLQLSSMDDDDVKNQILGQLIVRNLVINLAVSAFPANIELYRGMNQNDIEYYLDDKTGVMCVASLQSCSRVKDVSGGFGKLITFKVDKNIAFFAVDVKGMSAHQGEDEVLVPGPVLWQLHDEGDSLYATVKSN